MSSVNCLGWISIRFPGVHLGLQPPRVDVRVVIHQGLVGASGRPTRITKQCIAIRVFLDLLMPLFERLIDLDLIEPHSLPLGLTLSSRLHGVIGRRSMNGTTHSMISLYSSAVESA